jgi:pimeloyl-ACP methyl ester carboxylesterase
MTTGDLETLATGRWQALATLRSRFSFRFSATGRSAAAVVADGRGAAYVERWTCGRAGSCQALPDTWSPATSDGQTGVPVDAVPFDDGAVMLVRRREGAHELLASPGRGGGGPLGVLACPDLMTVPPPGAHGPTLVVGRTPVGWGSLWRLDDLTGPPRLVGPLPRPRLVGGGWLDQWGRRYALNVETAVGRVVPVAVDTATGAATPLVEAAGEASYQVLITSATAGRVLMATDAGGGWRFADLRAGGGHEPAVIPELDSIEGEVHPLTFDPTGRRVLLHVQAGVRSSLAIYDLAGRTLRRLPVLNGSVGGAAVWTYAAGRERLRFLYVSASMPFRIATVDPQTPGSWHLQDDQTEGNASPDWASARVERLTGAEGVVETIVHGYADWRSAEHVLLALHGGPERAWTMKFHQLFQYLAGYGITVVAPNPRGSAGYGDAYREAVRGAWAGPDLADVMAVSRYLREHRAARDRPLLLYGHSYGAFLALVAAAAAPEAWSRVVAIAPFLSGPRLRAEAPPAVRSMLDRLGACQNIDDALGSRDVIRLAHRIRAQVLVVHGENDPVIPVTQSRALRDHPAWSTAGDRFRYVEVAGAGHGPLDGSERVHAEVARFLVELPEHDPGVPGGDGGR